MISVANKTAMDPVVADAVERLTGQPVGSSESARIEQLASIGAAQVMAATIETGYKELAELLEAEPTVNEIQSTLGSPIPGETDRGLETLSRALAELDQ